MSRGQKPFEPELLRVGATHGAGTVSLKIAGELDITTRDYLQAQFEAALASRPESITVDASQLAFLDSSGFTGLLRARARAKETGVPFRIVEPSPAPRRVADVGGVGDEFLSDW